jgi:hypothetical protein
MKAVAIAMAAIMAFIVSTETIQAQTTARGGVYCKSGKIAKSINYCKENGGQR